MIQTRTVTEELTAKQVGSGLLPVYATPAVVAFMEATACATLDSSENPTPLPAGSTTVGIHIDVQHTKASAIGETITCEAILKAVEGRKFSFEIICTNAKGEVIATATHERFLVDAERFMAKLA